MSPSSLFLSIGLVGLLANPAMAAESLRRLDFKLEGVSCARCIINTRDALRGVKGVKRCEISLKKPYGGVVIYETGKTTVEALCKRAETADPKVPLKVMPASHTSAQLRRLWLYSNFPSRSRSFGSGIKSAGCISARFRLPSVFEMNSSISFRFVTFSRLCR